MLTQSIWLIGAGPMAQDYALVLKGLDRDFTTIGRGEAACNAFQAKTFLPARPGGLRDFLERGPSLPEFAIVAVGIEALAETTATLLAAGVKKILLEKPGVGYPEEIASLERLTVESEASVLLAYNRRFYASVRAARERIRDEGGVQSFTFEFTEWSHQIRSLTKTTAEHHNWFLGNSTHVLDTAFFLGGAPEELYAFSTGGLDWHPDGAIYVGAGVSDRGAPFSYHANWAAPGRWGIELMTASSRWILRPMEKLHTTRLGSIAVETCPIDDSLDTRYKPGLYLQTRAFLEGDWTDFITVSEQAQRMPLYLRMSGYDRRQSSRVEVIRPA